MTIFARMPLSEAEAAIESIESQPPGAESPAALADAGIDDSHEHHLRKDDGEREYVRVFLHYQTPPKASTLVRIDELLTDSPIRE